MPVLQLFSQPRRAARLVGLLLVVAASRPAAGPVAHPPRQPCPTQAQVARRFLLDVLQADYPAAYRRLAPEVRAGVVLPAFAAAARPLWLQGQARGAAIELYQVGVLLGGTGGHSQWFCRFSFAQDSARRPPPVLLQVTFRDTAARAVLGFGLRQRP